MLEIRFIPHQLSPSCAQTPRNWRSVHVCPQRMFQSSSIFFNSANLPVCFDEQTCCNLHEAELKLHHLGPSGRSNRCGPGRLQVCIEGERQLAPPGGRFWNTCLGVDLQKRQQPIFSTHKLEGHVAWYTPVVTPLIDNRLGISEED